jgi:pimeloyl-ACP methyl ester carboxylesterase
MGWVSHLEYFWTEPRFARFLRHLASFSRLILFDKRGTGLSDRVPVAQLPSIEQRMDDLRAVMEAAGSRQAVLCGVSEGGCMAACFSANYPERTRGLITIGAYAKRLWDVDYPWAPTREEREKFLEEIREHWGGPIGIEERAPSLAADPQFRDWWATYLRMGASPGAALALTRMNAEVDVRSVLPRVQVPALVIHRSGDRVFSIEEGRYIAARIPSARLVELPGDDHLPFVGDQDAILAEIARFLETLQLESEPQKALATVLVASVSDGKAEVIAPEFEAELKLFRSGAARLDGRSLVAMFDGPARAVRCACSIRDQAARRGFAARAGLHTGECLNDDRAALVGPAVQVASEIHARCAPGDVLVSGTLRDLVVGASLQFIPRGRLELAGLGVWQLLVVARG